MKKLKYNDFINKETINIEYKKFTFNMSGIPIDIEQAEYYCSNNLFEFNTFVINNIFKYFEYFLLKNVCAFFNSNINGYFYIGVTDSGFIEGIPYKGNFPKKLITQKMYELLSNYLKFDNNYDFDIQKLVKINFIKIELPDKPESSINPDYNIYLKKKEKYLETYNKFLNDISIWRNKHSFVTQKLVDLINNKESRIVIKKYIQDNDPSNSLIELLDTDYKFVHKSHDEIYHLKQISDNIYYWITMWKDEMSEKLKLIKPIHNYDNSFKAIPLNMIISASNMIPYWVHNNSNTRLHLISININGRSNNSKCKYFDFNQNKWLSCIRVISSSGEPEIQNKF